MLDGEEERRAESEGVHVSLPLLPPPFSSRARGVWGGFDVCTSFRSSHSAAVTSSAGPSAAE